MTSLLTVSPSPHVRSGMTTQKIMLLVVIYAAGALRKYTRMLAEERASWREETCFRFMLIFNSKIYRYSLEFFDRYLLKTKEVIL